MHQLLLWRSVPEINLTHPLTAAAADPAAAAAPPRVILSNLATEDGDLRCEI